MLKGLGDSKLIEGYEKKPTGPSLGLSVEYVSLAKRTYLRKLGVVGGTCHHPASPLLSEDEASISSSWTSSRSEYTVLLWNIGVTDVTSPSAVSYTHLTLPTKA